MSVLKKLAVLSASLAAAHSLNGVNAASANEPDQTTLRPGETPIIFVSNVGDEIEALQGAFTVPENRAEKNARTLTLRYVRFPATGDNPGPPIVYLAGGPGGSGVATAKWRRFPLFMAMREFGDVIALDQRGTGDSDQTPPCVSDVVIPDNRALPRERWIDLLRRSVRYCEGFWRSEGVDLRGYTTVESARDLDALRIHLGADKISLWGISYGTHLALAALKEMDGRIDRMVLASAEGLDQTVKLPSRTDAYFHRVQAVIDADPAAKAVYPDIAAMMRRVHARLETAPVMLSLQKADGTAADYLLQKGTMQMIASAMIADPEGVVNLLRLYAAADAGLYDPIAQTLQRFFEPGAAVEWRAMPLAMDLASGVGAERLARVENEAKSALLGDLLNFPMPQLAGAIEGLDLGDSFREAPRSDVPVLLLSGTLDGRTYMESQLEAVAGLSDLTTVTVVNAGHNLFMSDPAVTEAIQAFMRGEKIDKLTIELPAPDFARE